jgi:hypothetical protein
LIIASGVFIATSGVQPSHPQATMKMWSTWSSMVS